MQSQQKKVKWSRGETASALEERTDTGITQVSVSKMENIVADIYGNISRRPALKIVSSTNQRVSPIIADMQGGFDLEWYLRQPPYVFTFTIDSSSYVIFVAGQEVIQGFWIINGKFTNIQNIVIQPTQVFGEFLPFGNFGKASFVQSNNYGVLAGVYRDTIIIKLNTSTNTFYCDEFKCSAPWYAPNGTNSIEINATDIGGLEFNKDGEGFFGTTYTEASGMAVACSAIDTGLTGSTSSISSKIPIGSIVEFPNIGTYMRVEGFSLGSSNVYFSDIVFSSLIYGNGTIPSTGYCVQYVLMPLSDYAMLFAYYNGNPISGAQVNKNDDIVVRSTVSNTGYSHTSSSLGSWQNKTVSSLKVFMYGELLTPVANESEKDTHVVVETGYVSLNNYTPKEFAFSQQRLFATKWTSGTLVQKELPGYAVGSQIGRYNDFKNNYNTKSEAIVIDINTQYQEEVNYIADYNGIKIFTTDSEYAYSTEAGAVKQSTNGSSKQIRPLVFGSSLLYVDKTNKQIRVLQYELQTDIFQSNVLNQMCQQDLINNPISMSSFYDKENHTGSFLYVMQAPISMKADNSLYQQKTPIAVCNFVPGNQAEIWARWTVPTMPLDNYMAFAHLDKPTVATSITINNKVWFIVSGCITKRSDNNYFWSGYSLAELDYDSVLDFEITASPTDTKYVATRNQTLTGRDNLISLQGWTSPEYQAYTEYNQVLAIGNNVYNIFGQVIGTITAFNTGVTPNTITCQMNAGYTRTYYRNTNYDYIINDITFPNATVSVFDGDTFMWNDTLDSHGNYTKSLAELTNPRVGFMINATMESHPLDVGGKTYTDHKRIGKAVAVIRNTESGAFTVCDKTGYTAPDKKTVNFYGCTGMKDQVRYTIKNIKGAKFTIESLTMIIEYATLDS